MNRSPDALPRGYEDSYRDFDSPLMRRVRAEAYGKDIGQHSWVTEKELRQDASRLKLSSTCRVLDLGCGPAGPLAFVVNLTRCRGTGVDSSASAIAAGQARAEALALRDLLQFHQSDLNRSLPFADQSFEAVISLDVILHLPDRRAFFREVARVLISQGRFLFTDAGIITGSISDDEIRRRAVHGANHFVPPGFNEQALEAAGFRLLESENRTASLLKNASGRLTARLAHRAELEQLEGSAGFERQQRYLETVISLSERGSLSRMMYLAESRAA